MKKFFIVRAVKHWNSLPQEAGDAPSLEIFEATFEGALKEQFGGVKGVPPMAGGLELHEL